MPRTSIKKEIDLKKKRSAALQDWRACLPSVEELEIKIKIGPPSGYDPSWMCNEVINVALGGGFHAEMMLALGVSAATFYRWKADSEKYPEFVAAMEIADRVSLARLEKITSFAAEGKMPKASFNHVAFLLSSKYKDLYPRNGATEQATTNINITNNSVNMAPDELSSRIDALLHKYQSQGLMEQDLLPNPETVSKNRVLEIYDAVIESEEGSNDS